MERSLLAVAAVLILGGAAVWFEGRIIQAEIARASHVASTEGVAPVSLSAGVSLPVVIEASSARDERVAGAISLAKFGMAVGFGIIAVVDVRRRGRPEASDARAESKAVARPIETITLS